MKADVATNSWRNVIATLVCASAWACIYLVPASDLLNPTARLLLLPLFLGVGEGFALAGAWPEKVGYIFAAPVVPVLYFGFTFSAGTDPEGSAYAWMLAGAPLFPYLVGAGGITAFLELRKNALRKH